MRFRAQRSARRCQLIRRWLAAETSIAAAIRRCEHKLKLFVCSCEGVFDIQGNPDPQRKHPALLSISSEKFLVSLWEGNDSIAGEPEMNHSAAKARS
jgi:hypothetical protein